MLERLKTEPKVVGVKQCGRAIREDRASCVFFAADADPALIDPLRTLCQTNETPVVDVRSMKELGTACSISVGAAVAALLKASN